MANSCLDEIASRFVVSSGAAPAAVVAVARRAERGFETGSGAASVAGPFACSRDSFFDLASVSKPFLATTVARLARRGRLSFASRLDDLLPQARGSATGAQSVELLLSHRAGLEAHRALFAPLLAQAAFDPHAAVAEALRARRPECSAAAPR